MKKIILITFSIFLGCKNNNEANITPTFGILIHGGAGTILKKNMSSEKEVEYRNILKKAIEVGYKILEAGGNSQDAVEKTIHIMEDSPLFNAGKGAVLNALGNIELDASFMNGSSLDAGAVSGVKTVKHPISAAIKVMEASPHVMLSGSGADILVGNGVLQITSYEIKS